MSFDISVRRRDNPSPEPPPMSAELSDFEAWLTEDARRVLYENPLGADGTIYKWWHAPAHKLGLTLISLIYNRGLRISGDDVVRLAAELDLLEKNWAVTNLTVEEAGKRFASHGGGKTEQAEIQFKDFLSERANYLRHAIAIAIENDGVITIC